MFYSFVYPKGLPPAKSEASNSHGSVPFPSKLGDVRVSHIRKERTESGSLTCVTSADQPAVCTNNCCCVLGCVDV